MTRAITGFARVVRACGMSSADGHLSHSKCVTWGVLLTYCLGAALPTAVAVVLVISSYGAKMMGRAIERGVLNVRASSSDYRETREETRTETIDVRVQQQILERRDPSLGAEPSP